MGLRSDLFVAPAADASKYNDDPGIFAASRAEFGGLTCREFAELWAVLCNREPKGADVEAFVTLLNVRDGQRTISQFPEDMVARLAEAGVDDLRGMPKGGSSSANLRTWIAPQRTRYHASPR